MKQVPLQARKEYDDIVNDSVSIVPIRGTKKKVKLHWIKPYTMERLTRVWLERDLASAKIEKAADVLKDLAVEPYFVFKEAALMILNNDLKIRFFYPLYWRWLAYKYDETQMLPIVEEGKKKLPLMAHYGTMLYSMDMRTDMMKMTKKEAEQYRAELLSGTSLPSSRTSLPTATSVGGSSDGKGTSATDAS